MVLLFTENFWKEFIQHLLNAFCILGSMLGAVGMQGWVRHGPFFQKYSILWESAWETGSGKSILILGGGAFFGRNGGRGGWSKGLEEEGRGIGFVWHTASKFIWLDLYGWCRGVGQNKARKVKWSCLVERVKYGAQIHTSVGFYFCRLLMNFRQG